MDTIIDYGDLKFVEVVCDMGSVKFALVKPTDSPFEYVYRTVLDFLMHYSVPKSNCYPFLRCGGQDFLYGNTPIAKRELMIFVNETRESHVTPVEAERRLYRWLKENYADLRSV